MDFGKRDVNAEKMPAQPTVAAAPAPTVVKKSRSAWSTVAFFFMLLLLIAAGCAAWMWMMWQDSHNQLVSTKSQLTAAETTIAGLRDKVSQANGEAAALAKQPVNDEALIKVAAKTYNDALATPLKNPTITVTKKDGAQAIATVADLTSGYKVFLKKVNNTWVAFFAGQNVPPADIAQQFGLTI